MNQNFFFFYNNLIKLSLINSFNFKNSYNISKQNKIILSFNIKDSFLDITSVYFPKTLWLLEHISLQKGHIVNLKTKRFGRNQRRVIFSSRATLRNINLFDFIYFFLCFICFNLFRKFLSFNDKLDRLTANYSFFISDINVYPGFLEDFFKWLYPVMINIIIGNYDLVFNQHILQELGFNVV